MCKIIFATKYKGHNELNTDVLPQYNCSNCKHFNNEQVLIEISKGNCYAVECSNFVHPLEDCILRGFEGHSEQPGLSQTLNKKES